MSDGVFPFTAALFSSGMTLSVPYGGGGGCGCDDLPVALGIKPGACGFGGYSPGVYGFSV